MTQFKLLLAPREAVDLVAKQICSKPEELEDAELAETAAGQQAFATEDLTRLCDELGHLLPPGKSWSDEMLRFGQEDGDRIEVYCAEGKRCIEAVEIRVDCTKVDHGFLKGLCRLLSVKGWVMIVVRTGMVIEPDYKSLLPVLRDSWAMMIAEDPELNLPLAADDLKDV